MKALVIDLRLGSLFSIRMPYTWMSALTYPVLPPSAVKGMIANALQRLKNDKPPLEYLKLVEETVVWAGSRLISPCTVKSYIVSNIIKLETAYGEKATDAMVRQFAHTKNMQVIAILKNDAALNDLIEGLTSVPLTCGDSESAVTVEGVQVKDVKLTKDNETTTSFPVPFDGNVSLIRGSGKICPMHERCLKSDKVLPLKNFIIPVKENNGIIIPTQIDIRINNGQIYDIESLVKVVGFT